MYAVTDLNAPTGRILPTLMNLKNNSYTEVSLFCQPFWRLWNSAGSDGRGVIGALIKKLLNFLLVGLLRSTTEAHNFFVGVLEANFVEPAHDKQGFERTIVLSRLEGRLIQMQKTYW